MILAALFGFLTLIGPILWSRRNFEIVSLAFNRCLDIVGSISSRAKFTRHRVKVHRLSNGGRSIEQVTGLIRVDYSEGSKDVGFYFVKEEDNETVLLHRITSNDIFSRKSDTGIVWRKPKCAYVVFLTFQEENDRDFIWDNIRNVQRSIRFNALVKYMISDVGDELEFLRNLADSKLHSIVDIFYERHLSQLIDVITSSCPPNTDSHVKPETLLRICELLQLCISNHPKMIIRCNFLVNNVIDKVLLLTRRREKYLVVAAIQFLKALVCLEDKHVDDHIVKNDLFRPVVFAFVHNGTRYNLLNSTYLGLVEFIRKKERKTLIKYLEESC